MLSNSRNKAPQRRRTSATPCIILALVAVLVVSVAAMSGIAAARGSTTIKVGDDYFAPDKKTVSKGTKVKFNWVGDDEHDIVKLSGPGRDFDSGPLEGSGVLFSKKFKKAGTYKIICSIHDGMDMKLIVK